MSFINILGPETACTCGEPRIDYEHGHGGPAPRRQSPYRQRSLALRDSQSMKVAVEPFTGAGDQGLFPSRRKASPCGCDSSPRR